MRGQMFSSVTNHFKELPEQGFIGLQKQFDIIRKQLLPDDIGLLLQTNETLLRQFLEMICNAAEHLSSYQTNQLIALLQPLYNKNEWLQQRLTGSLFQQRKDERWQKNKIVLAVALALILCVIIFFAASA